MVRALSIKNLYDKAFNFMPFEGVWKETLGRQTRSGIWLVYGFEKNGKTTFSLMLANYLSSIERVLYVSAEEGADDAFVDTCRRAGVDYGNKSLRFWEYSTIDELLERLGSRKAEKIVFVDNLFVYRKEITEDTLIRLKREYPDTLFVFIAHEEKGEAYPGNAESCRKLAKVVFRVQGMAVEIGGRGGAGGTITVDHERALIYHGSKIINKISN
jgi:KaiC/GvpD/RAD55 family RecA-like ATPase